MCSAVHYVSPARACASTALGTGGLRPARVGLRPLCARHGSNGGWYAGESCRLYVLGPGPFAKTQRMRKWRREGASRGHAPIEGTLTTQTRQIDAQQSLQTDFRGYADRLQRPMTSSFCSVRSLQVLAVSRALSLPGMPLEHVRDRCSGDFVLNVAFARWPWSTPHGRATKIARR